MNFLDLLRDYCRDGWKGPVDDGIIVRDLLVSGFSEKKGPFLDKKK